MSSEDVGKVLFGFVVLIGGVISFVLLNMNYNAIHKKHMKEQEDRKVSVFTNTGNRVIGDYNFTIQEGGDILKLNIAKITSKFDNVLNYSVRVIYGSKEITWCGLSYKIDTDKIYPNRVTLGYVVIPKCEYDSKFNGTTRLKVSEKILIDVETINFFIKNKIEGI